MITLIGLVFVLLVVWAVMLDRTKLPWLLSAACCFTATGGIIVAGQNVQNYYVVAIAMIGLAVLGINCRRLLAVDLRDHPGLTPLVTFGIWALLVTATAPFVFAGTGVLNPRVGIDDGIVHPAALGYQISNFAQSGYLVFGIAVVIVVGSTAGLSARLPAVGLAVGTVLSSARFVLPEDLGGALFDSSPNVSYSAGSISGAERMRGIFSEPSGLGGFEVTAAVFFIMTASRTVGWRRYASLGMAFWSLANAVLSGSGTALVGGLIILAVITVHAVYGYGIGRSRVSAAALVGSLAALPAAIVLGPSLYRSAAGVVGDKVGSSSYENRSGADLFSIDLTWQTYGIGVGVGANRPSSFAAMLLAATGVLGAILFAVAMVVMVAGAARVREFQPAAWALVSLMFSKLVAGPDLSDPTMWFLLAVCANAAWRRRSVENRRRLVPSPVPRLLTARSVR